MISTQRRLEYASGFIELGMLDEVSDELESIAFTDRLLPAVLLTRIELSMEAKHWDMVIDLGRALTKQCPEHERPWIALAYALREQQQIAAAREVLLEAESLHGRTSSILHYNLACYYSLLGDQRTAKERLRRACKMEQSFKQAALEDQDLSALWGQIPAMS